VAYEFDNAQHGADLFNLEVPGNVYTRIMNPTNDVLEQRLAALEGGIAALVVSAGSAAINYAIQTLARAGDNIVSASTLYGGNYNLGITDQSIFPELSFEETQLVHGMQITFAIKEGDKVKSRALLEKFGLPFEKEGGR
jgi:O-acetylhomoserine/O-acetylserine sulfhydrylase-like pyridoxal-dependent enzyme